MPVNPNHANFTPTLSGYSGQHPFRFWCQKVLPLVYDDSLSYYELLNKVVVYLNNAIADVAAVEGNVDELASAYDQLQNYVNTWFDNVDLQNETEIALDKMAENGELDTLIEPFVAEQIDGVVAEQIDEAVGNQIDGAVADQIGNVVAEQIATPTATAVTSWLTDNVDPVGSAVVVDSSLTIAGAAADAKAVGDAIDTVYESASSGVNLANGLEWTDGYSISDTGTISTANNYRYSSLIDVNYDNIIVYISQISATSSITTRVLGYNNGVFVEQLAINTEGGAKSLAMECDCSNINGIRISTFTTNNVRGIFEKSTNVAGYAIMDGEPYSVQERANARLMAKNLTVPPSLKESTAYKPAWSYMYMFETINKFQNGSFTDGTYAPGTLNTGNPIVSNEVYVSRGYSLKCFGNVDTNIMYSVSLSSGHRYEIIARVRVDRYVSGKCGIYFSDDRQAYLSSVTDGFEFVNNTIRPTGNTTYNVLVGTFDGADADCYIDDIAVIEISDTFSDISIGTAPGLNTAIQRLFEMQNNYIDIVNGKKISVRKTYNYSKPKFVAAIMNATSDDSRFLCARNVLRIAECILNGSDYSDYEKRLMRYAGMGAVTILPETPSMYQKQADTPIYSYNGDTGAVPASVTKTMNLITAMPYITSIKNRYTISASDIRTGSGNIFQSGDIVSIEDLMYAAMLPSSNTAATAIAHYVGGIILGDDQSSASECLTAFLSEMNANAVSLGCTNTIFRSVSGLLDGAEEHSSTTCNDVVKIGIEAASWDIMNRIWNNDAHAVKVYGANARTINIETTVKSTTLEDAYTILGGKTGTLTGITPEAHTLLVICEPK